MGKQKYTPDGGLKIEDGERKQRDHTKSGKKAARKDNRRHEAVERQQERINGMESRLTKVKNKNDYLRKIARAKVVLQCLKGGTPHERLWAALKAAPTGTPEPTA